MVETRPTGDRLSGAIRPDGGSAHAAPGRTTVPGDPPGRPRSRIPSAAQLAALLTDGFLNLPRNYRRGMYLDIVT